MTSDRIALVTCDQFPDGTPDDRLLYDALAARGAEPEFVAWSDPEADWGAYGAVVIRSTWDYFHRPTEFRAWLDAVEGRAHLLNDVPTVRWNMDKHYLADLAARGVAVVPTVFVRRGSDQTLAQIAAARGWDEVVAKPTISGSALGAKRVRPDAEGEAHLRALTAERDAMVQPYLAAVEDERERSLIFLDGAFSHAYRKAPFNAGSVTGTGVELIHEATEEELAFARRVIAAAGRDLAYARVDMVPSADGPLLMELEVIEPSLQFGFEPFSAQVFAGALLARAAAYEQPVSVPASLRS
jgi:glutathione synthase/RimK-type ligase-like ATP-grasp enzyme